MKIADKDRLIPKMIVLLGLVASISLTGVSLKLNNHRNATIKEQDDILAVKSEMIDDFKQGDNFKSSYDIHNEVLSEQAENMDISQSEYEKQLEYLNSREFVESVMNASKDKEVIKRLRALNTEYQKLDDKIDLLKYPMDFSLLAGVVSAFATVIYAHHKRGYDRDEEIEDIITKSKKRHVGRTAEELERLYDFSYEDELESKVVEVDDNKLTK